MALRSALLLVVVGVLSRALWAGDPPALASPEDAAQALQKFEGAFEAKGLTGDERLAVREQAMRELAKVQYPTVTDRLVKLSRDKDPDLRTLAVMYLGQQKLLPGYAGKAVVSVLSKGGDDPIFLMFCGDALQSLDYRGQVQVLRTLLTSKDEAVRKRALVVIGKMKETRLVQAVLDLMVELKIDHGEKWAGTEGTVDDSGAGGDTAAGGTNIGPSGSGAPGKGKGGAAAAGKMRDMKPMLLQCMKELTGQEFTTTDEAKAWVAVHKAEIDARNLQLAATQKDQDAAAKFVEAQLKALR